MYLPTSVDAAGLLMSHTRKPPEYQEKYASLVIVRGGTTLAKVAPRNLDLVDRDEPSRFTGTKRDGQGR